MILAAPKARAAADPIEVLLREILDVQRQILAVLERQRPPSTLSRSDQAALSRILPAIGGVLGSELFATRELFESNEAALRVVLNGLTAKTVGQLFHRGKWQAIDGYQVEHHGSELNTALWRVVKVHGTRTSQNLTVPPRPADRPPR